MTDDISGAPLDTPSAPEAAPSISDIASNAIDIAEARAADRAAGKTVSDDLPSAKPDRARDEHGKFASKPAPSKEPVPAAQTAPTPPPAAAPEAPQPPARWSDADKAVFAGLPPAAQKAVLDRNAAMEADYTRKTQELAEQRKSVEPYAGAINEHADFLQSMSQQVRQPPARIVGDVLQLYRQLVTGTPQDKVQALGFVARIAGIDPRTLAGGQGAVQAPDPIINDLRQQLAELQGFKRSAEQERQQNEFRAAETALNAFRTAKDEQGQPKYPHFDAVRALMAPHVERGASFEDAYAAAAKPIVDAIAARDSQARGAASAADKARADSVARARNAGSPRLSGSTPGGSFKPSSMAERVSQALDAVGI